MDIASRLSQLSPHKRALLARRIAEQGVGISTPEADTDGKRLVAYVVSHQQLPLSLSELRRFLKEKLPEYMVPAAFVMLDALPLLPNGKVDRRALPAPDQGRATLEAALVAPRTPIEHVLARVWGEVLGIEQIGINDNFFDLGGDSILSLRIVAKANQAGLRMSPMQIFQHQTIAALAAVVGIARAIKADQGEVRGQLPLTPIQHWFFAQDPPDPHHANMAMLLEGQYPLDPALLEQAVQQLLIHHDALRLRFVREPSGWQQINAALDEAVSFTRIDLSGKSQEEQRTAIEAVAVALQTTLNLSAGPLLRGAFFDLGAYQPSRLLLIIHHLVVDAVSWQILLEDLQTAYQQLSRGEAIQLPPKTTSFKYWAERLTEYTQSDALQEELNYWLAAPQKQFAGVPVDFPQGERTNTVASARTVSVSLSVEETRALLQDVPKAYRTQINEVLLTALVQAFSPWTGAQSLLIELEGHGREDLFEDVDLSRTVGWFTTLFPVLLDLGNTSHPEDALKTIKEQLRRIPNRGIGYSVLRYLSQDTNVVEKLRTLPQPEVNFNYLGQLDQMLPDTSLFRLARESSGPDRSVRGIRSHLLEIVGFISEGRLHTDWTYSEKVHRRATIASLAHGFMEALQVLISHCQSPEAGGYTPSDFPEAGLSQEELEDLLVEIGEANQ